MFVIDDETLRGSLGLIRLKPALLDIDMPDEGAACLCGGLYDRCGGLNGTFSDRHEHVATSLRCLKHDK